MTPHTARGNVGFTFRIELVEIYFKKQTADLNAARNFLDI